MLADFEQSNIDLKHLANYEYIIKAIKGDELFTDIKIDSNYLFCNYRKNNHVFLKEIDNDRNVENIVSVYQKVMSTRKEL